MASGQRVFHVVALSWFVQCVRLGPCRCGTWRVGGGGRSCAGASRGQRRWLPVAAFGSSRLATPVLRSLLRLATAFSPGSPGCNWVYFALCGYLDSPAIELEHSVGVALAVVRIPTQPW